MRRKSLEMTSNQVKNGLEWGDSMSGAPRAVEKETSRQRRSCARWVFPQPAKPFKPVPDGFEMDFSRKILPAGERE